AEDNCWPDKTLAPRYPPAPTKYKFLNSGGFYARFDAFVAALAAVESYEAPDDQWCWAKTWLDGRVKLAPDYNCRIFQSLKRSEDEMAYGERILNVLTETEPCVFHGNGGADMSRVIKFILGPAYLDLDDLADDHEVASQNVLPESSRIQTVKPLIKQPANKRAPAGFHRAAAATKPVPKPAIGIVVHDEEPQLLIECLRHARAACAHALIFVI